MPVSATAGTLCARVYVNAQGAGHRLLDLSWTLGGRAEDKSTGGRVSSGDTFNEITDGAAHSCYIFFWVNTGNAVLNAVYLGLRVGTSGTANRTARSWYIADW